MSEGPAHASTGDARPTTGPVLLDARGLRCPLPVIRLAQLAGEAAPGAHVTVLWTDPAAEHDIPAWARMRGHATLRTEHHRDHGSTTVQLGA